MVQSAAAGCSPAGKKKATALVEEAVGALSLAYNASRAHQYKEGGKQLEFAFGKLHNAIEIIRMETRTKRKGKTVPLGVPKSLGEYA